jgi:hypothetical protein
MAEAIDLFERCLETHGIDANVSLEKKGVQSSFEVACDFGSTTLYRSKALTYDEDAGHPDDFVEKEIVLMAEQLARDIKLETIKRVVWYGDNPHAYNMSRIESTPPEAWCPYCASKATFPESERVYGKEAELSHPKPKIMDKDTLYNSLEPHQKAIVDLYLIGELYHSCQEDCYNSTERFISE